MNSKAIIGVILALVVIGVVAAASSMSSKDEMMKDKMLKDEMMKNKEGMMADEKDGVMVGGALMVANLDIVDNAANANNVTTLVAAVKAAGLVETLKGPGPFTVFAPTNAAFEKLPAGTVETLLKSENKPMLFDILTYHVVSGRLTSADLTDGKVLTTVQGKTIKIGNVDGKITVNGQAMVETKDVISSNGVTFVIDTVLMPPTK